MEQDKTKFKIVSSRGVLTVAYDLDRIQEEDEHRYAVRDSGGDIVYVGHPELQLGDTIPLEVAAHVEAYLDREDDVKVYGFIVPEYLLPTFSAKRGSTYDIHYGPELNQE